MRIYSYKNILLSTIALSGIILSSCKPAQNTITKTYSQFSELDDPSKSSVEPWTSTPEGLNISYVSIDKKYYKSEEPKIGEYQTTHRITGWKGEKVSSQILLWSTQSVEEVEISISSFQSPHHNLPASIAELRFVRYVMTDEFGEGCGYRQPEDFAASLAPDMLDNITTMDIESNTVRPIWITVNIPHGTPAGLYSSSITIHSKDAKDKTLAFELEVTNETLPAPNKWTYHLDLWQHPAAVARVQDIELWSDAHFEALKPVMKMLADAGQKVITTTLNKDPWNNQCYDTYADMITWTKNEDDSWTYDYTIFDKWVSLMMELGINKMINCYSVVPWNNELHYQDAALGERVTIQANPGSDLFNKVWHHFFTDFKAHLAEKGWLKITNIAMDERTPEEMEATIEMLQKEAPELGISYADNQKSYKKYPFIKEISLAAGAKFEQEDIQKRKEEGLITTYYVCCSDAFPNTFTFSEPAEAVYAGWYALASGLDGFLRWAYNSWVENPLTDSRFRTWPAGDTYIVYPDARSSIRFERLIEGIQDVEKIKILQTKLKSNPSKKNNALLEELQQTLAAFTIHPEQDYVELLNKGKALLNRITKELDK